MSTEAMSQVELHFKGRKLLNMDGIFDKSDPIVQVYFQKPNRTPEFIGQTERIDNNLNPDWATSVLVDYFFEEEQIILCKVLDIDNDKVTFTDADFIGQCSFPLGRLVTAKGQTLSSSLTLPGKTQARGYLTVQAEVVELSNKVAIISLGCENIPKSTKRCCLGGRSIPRASLVIRRVREDGEWAKVVETGATTQNTRDPSWPEFEVSVGRLCNGDLDRPLKVEIVDLSRGNDNPPVLCMMETTLRVLESADGKELHLKSYIDTEEAGGLLHSTVRLIQIPTFLDYLNGGTELNLHIAIDFTASNGNPMDPKSLHCLLNPNAHNQYQQVIQSVGGILQHYDSDQMYPVWGFGAKIAHNVSHCFPCNSDGTEVHGLHGVHQVYLQAAKRVQFSGPTLFAPMLNQLMVNVQEAMRSEPFGFHIMLILTDGCIHDMDQTIDAIVRSSSLPISIIIVGIGEADFTNMNTLDADGSRLRASNGEYQKHDNVQFVPYSSVGQSSARLARDVLMELPEQVVTHFKQRGISPQPPREVESHAASVHRGESTGFARSGTVGSLNAAPKVEPAGQAFIVAGNATIPTASPVAEYPSAPFLR
eukprot:GEMP01017580.1.p1 GENE.GEMP01017580.1~~GEMP01017580.1.p1  ORF type:complete len:591 (+),score=103.78 GEMP01017580.1:57-1829(+)